MSSINSRLVEMNLLNTHSIARQSNSRRPPMRIVVRVRANDIDRAQSK